MLYPTCTHCRCTHEAPCPGGCAWIFGWETPRVALLLCSACFLEIVILGVSVGTAIGIVPPLFAQQMFGAIEEVAALERRIYLP